MTQKASSNVENVFWESKIKKECLLYNCNCFTYGSFKVNNTCRCDRNKKECTN